jgi:hypothetical protein
MSRLNFFIIALASFTIEIASTMYISTVSDKSIFMIFWAAIGPFLGLPFVGFMIEAKTWKGRVEVAAASAFGYSIGAMLVYIYFSMGF